MKLGNLLEALKVVVAMAYQLDGRLVAPLAVLMAEKWDYVRA